jgi:putative endonuclease
MIGALLDKLRHIRRRRIWSADQATGRRGEDLAHRFLRKRGYVIVARNHRLPSGDAEADLICRDGEYLVIVEVKTRETADFGPPDRAIGVDKQRHLGRIARAYARKAEIPWERVRCDVVTVILSNPPELNLLRGAVDLLKET